MNLDRVFVVQSTLAITILVFHRSDRYKQVIASRENAWAGLFIGIKWLKLALNCYVYKLQPATGVRHFYVAAVGKRYFSSSITR